MQVKVYFTSDGSIFRADFMDLFGKCLIIIGALPVVQVEKLNIITVDMRDLENLVTLLANL
jgi:hypothetical protein